MLLCFGQAVSSSVKGLVWLFIQIVVLWVNVDVRFKQSVTLASRARQDYLVCQVALLCLESFLLYTHEREFVVGFAPALWAETSPARSRVYLSATRG